MHLSSQRTNLSDVSPFYTAREVVEDLEADEEGPELPYQEVRCQGMSDAESSVELSVGLPLDPLFYYIATCDSLDYAYAKSTTVHEFPVMYEIRSP